jgi:hypothetical protein
VNIPAHRSELLICGAALLRHQEPKVDGACRLRVGGRTPRLGGRRRHHVSVGLPRLEQGTDR